MVSVANWSSCRVPRRVSDTEADRGTQNLAPCFYLQLDRAEANMVFQQLVSSRYERGSMIINSKKSLAEWGQVLSDDVLTTTILNRSCTTALCWQPTARATASKTVSCSSQEVTPCHDLQAEDQYVRSYPN